jgi:invasion protein IalB
MIRSKIQMAAGAIMVATGFAVVSLVPAPAVAQQQQPPANNWYKVCSKQEDNDICNVQFQLVASTGQLVTAVSLLEIKGKITGRKFQVTVPPGRVIPPGIKLQIDDGKELGMPYAVCFPQRCVAEVQLDDKFVTSLKAGKDLTLTSINFQGKPNPVKVTLSGFTAAFDGPPLKQDELEERQRQLQEELRRKAEEQRRRIQEEQTKAKQGTN